MKFDIGDIILVLLLGVYVGFLVGVNLVPDTKADAIKNNVGKYVCDPKTGNTQFQWVTNFTVITNIYKF